MLEVIPYTGEDARQHIDALARLRIEVFREFPYLYEGSMDYERQYLRTFLEAPDSLLVLALDGERVVGASSALPLEFETPNIRQPFLEQGRDIGRIFYYGESVLLRPYRGQGLGLRFFEERERRARQLGRFSTLAFCAVVRPETHPLRPIDYIPLDAFWRRRGFAPTDMYCRMSWQDVDEETETAKALRFWVKELE